MKIVIDIEEGRYNWIMSHASKHPYDYADASDLFFRTAVERGIVLPNENEGDLISREALKEAFADMREGYPIFSDTEMVSTKDIASIIDNAPAVIKADK